MNRIWNRWKKGRRKHILVFKNALARDIGSDEEENNVRNKSVYSMQWEDIKSEKEKDVYSILFLKWRVGI